MWFCVWSALSLDVCNGSVYSFYGNTLYAIGPYAPNQTCTRLVDQSSYARSKATLQITALTMGAGDWLKVYDGKNATATLLVTYTSASTAFSLITGTTSYLYIVLYAGLTRASNHGVSINVGCMPSESSLLLLRWRHSHATADLMAFR